MNETNLKWLTDKLKESSANDPSELIFFPSYLHIETFMGCNARCIMCGIDEWKRNKTLMTHEIFDRVACEVISHREKVERVSMHLGGEPLLDRYLAQRIKTLKEGGVKSVFFTTNASLLNNDEKIIEILESNVDQIDISFHSIDEEKYETIMKGLKFEKVLSNIKRLVELRDRMGKQTKIRIRSVEMLCNQDEKEIFTDFWKKILNFDFGDLAYAKSVNERFVSEKNLKNNGELIGEESLVLDVNKLPCYPLWSSAFILSDGRVALCCVDMGKNVILGDLKQQTLGEIWRESKILQDFRKKHLEHGRGSCSLCKNCNVWL